MNLRPYPQGRWILPIFALFLGTTLRGTSAFADDTCNRGLKNKSVAREKFLNPKIYEENSDGRVRLALTQKKGLIGDVTNFAANAVLRPLFSIKKMEGAVVALRKLMQDPSKADVPYYHKVAEAFQLDYKFNENFLPEIPKTGPLLITMNHPLSGLELLAVAAAIQRVRPDVKVISSKFLDGMPGLIDNAILLDNMGGDAARSYNISRRQMILESLERGEALVVSPAGAVSIKENLSDAVALDPPWKLGVADFIKKVPGTQVLPVYVSGGVSANFHRARALHPFAGTAMILREISEGIGTEIRFLLSKPLSPADLAKFKSRRELTSYLRARTYMLAATLDGNSTKKKNTRVRTEPIAEPLPDDQIRNELYQQRVIYDLAPDNSEKGMKTFMAFGHQIPSVLQEIGRLREITFWKANEGTGKARDLDKYDPNYLHLIAWDKKAKRIAGAYRIGLTDQIVSQYGFDGTYVSNYFNVEPYLNTFLSQLVEIGRSFVLPEYQGRSLALPVLLGGVGRFMAWHPQYHGFFGAVSVSDDYQEMSKALILKWAEKHEGAKEFGLIASKNPPRFATNLTSAELDLLVKYAVSFKDLNDLVASAENNPKARAPQLIQIYKELGTKFLAFDKDIEFNTIDGLIFTSILNLTHEQRLYYMGTDGAENFENYWSERLRQGPPPFIPAE